VSVTDAQLLARIADCTVFVVQHNSIDKRLIKRSVAALRKAGANVLGAVLNSVPEGDRADYYYYSYRPTEAPAAPARGPVRKRG
jgi:Mrp family chromosome partitioning ATPase